MASSETAVDAESGAGYRPRPLFLVGSPRSGTTWVQLLLHQSPHVATAPETQIFAYYLDHFRKQWELEHRGPASRHQGGAGLHRLLSQDEFDRLCAEVAWFVLERIRAARPEARVVVEKSPRHALIANWIVSIVPESWILHVVRDPRDACASVMEAGQTWAAGWAPTNPIDAARFWRAHVEGARAVADVAERYLEVRYEALRTDPDGGLRLIFDWLDLPHDAAFRERALKACGLERLRSESTNDLPVPGGESPSGFFGSGSVGGWRDRLSDRQARVIEHLCRDLMEEAGYSAAYDGHTRLPPLRVSAHDALARLRESIDWQLERLLRRV